VDGKSILSILTLCATRGTELVIRAQGDDAEDAVCQLSKLVELGFDE
jgi:phosphotransferase system HPr (HPr) family protein